MRISETDGGLNDHNEREQEHEETLRHADVYIPSLVIEDRTITVVLNVTDAAVIGTTLRMLAQANRSPDLEVAGRMRRVGDQLAMASWINQVSRGRR
jgi:hypothetical protein